MLRALRVRNFLLVHEVAIELAAGLAVLTGETGTGKSILLDALGLLLGGRGSSAWVRQGAEALHVEATFEVDRRTQGLLREMGVPCEGRDLILAREIDRNGRSRCFANGHRVLVGSLQRLGSQLVEVHGQREEERFRRPDVQRDLLDLHGGHLELRRAVRNAFVETRGARDVLERHRARIARLTEEEDWLRFQLTEIDEIHPHPEETETLKERVRALRQTAEREDLTELAERLLNGRAGAILESLEELDHRISALSIKEDAWEEFGQAIRELLGRAREAYRALGNLRSAAGEGLEELGRLEERLAELERLQQKHRKPLAEILDLADEMRRSLESLEESKQEEEVLLAKLEDAATALRGTARRLREAREKAASEMARAIWRELELLGMKGCRLRVALRPLAREASDAADFPDTEGIGPNGSERVIFEMETNPGEGFRPLGEIASGGEMSRIALAIRVVLGGAGRSRLTVFDEIDAGLGGAAAKAVAGRLGQVARHRQVLLVTHLPVIAAQAQRQYRVWKEKRDGRNVAFVAEVRGTERGGEVARMLAGEASDAQARRHARVLLGSGG
jgi:DNA repair protein RecN (Recombination protein N)